ncbi:hypothetical protein C8R47DRAFT_1205740 [Mycena vitilis]|nr:hypothetical protein C8R47DRAFT_1155793 [Mycena vitilis]KAJ6517520.1 hypothetical protein C8R47DRAFT_1205740 [Mycena vitilis]
MSSTVGLSNPGVSAIDPPWVAMLYVTKDTSSTGTGTCELCRRETDQITRHHLYPRVATRKAAASGFPFTPEQTDSLVPLCWPCHCIVHRLIPADILAAAFHSIDLLLTHGGVDAWLRWARQPDHTMEFLHSLMITKDDPEVVKKGGRPPMPAIQDALDTIWAENQEGFPRLEGKKKKTHGHALRQKIRRVMGNNTADKLNIQAAMSANPKYREWQLWVFGHTGRE